MFFKKQRDVKNDTNLPILENLYNGVCYKIEGTLYYIRGGKSYKFFSYRAFQSWRLTPVDADYTWPPHWMEAKTLGFRDGTLIQNAKDGKIYLISDARRLLLTRPLSDYGFDISQVLEVSNEEVEFHIEGEEV
jgi:hypothetical protein